MGLGVDTYILQGIAAGDFNADGRDDIAVAVDDVSAFPPQAVVLVYLNSGNGFAQPVAYPLSGSFPSCLEALDVTGDGALDLIACQSRSDNGNAEGLVAVLAGALTAGKANGSFQSLFSGVVGTSPSGVDSGDIDGDGRGDLLVVDAQRVWVLYGTNGLNRFEAPVELTAVTAPVAALIDAVPGQPLPELLVVNAVDGTLLTFAQPAPRTFATPTQQTVALLPTAMGLAKIDSDNINDLIILSGLGAELWYGQADGSFRFGESLTNDNSLDALALADLNGDGRIDVAASDSNDDRVTVVLNGADVPFTPSPTPTITPTPTRTGTPTRTAPPTRTGGPACPGDCDGTHMVSIADLIRGVNIALGEAPLATCPAFDLDNNGRVSVNELVSGVNSALVGCPS